MNLQIISNKVEYEGQFAVNVYDLISCRDALVIFYWSVEVKYQISHPICIFIAKYHIGP